MMSKTLIIAVILGIGATVPAAAPALAQGDEGSVEWILRQCATIENDARRYACYDNVLRPGDSNARPQLPPGLSRDDGRDRDDDRAAVPPPASYPATPEQRRRDEFGLEDRRRAEKRQRERETQEDELAVVVVDVRTRPRGEGVFITRGGQVWWQIDGELDFPPDTPFNATIKKGMLGSYRLAPEDSNRRYRVKRQQ